MFNIIVLLSFSFTRNLDDGLVLFDTDNSTISYNTINNNANNGIDLQGSHHNDILNNDATINDNDYCGINLMQSNYTTIAGNVINNNDIGVCFNQSFHNSLSYNEMIGNNKAYLEVNCWGNIIQNNDFGEGEKEPEPETLPKEFPIFIILIIIIGVVGAAGGIVAIKRSKTKYITSEKIEEKIKAPEEKIVERKAIKPKKVKKIKSTPAEAPGMTEEEKLELKKTEAEVDVEKQQFICLVHKGLIRGTMYTCPECQTLYCLKCATVLKEKGEKCWSCDKEFEL